MNVRDATAPNPMTRARLFTKKLEAPDLTTPGGRCVVTTVVIGAIVVPGTVLGGSVVMLGALSVEAGTVVG